MGVVRTALTCVPVARGGNFRVVASRSEISLVIRYLSSDAAFGMNTTSSHEFEFEYGEFGVFKFMIIRRHSIQTHDNFAVKNHEFEYFHE